MGVLEVPIECFGINLNEIGQFFKKSVLGPKNVTSVLSKRTRKDIFELPFLITIYHEVLIPAKLGFGSYSWGLQ